MKRTRLLILLAALSVASLLPRSSQAQPIYQTSNFTNSFDNNGNTGLYTSPDAIYWYSIYQNYFGVGYNLPMTNDASMDADGDTNNSGSLYVYSPFNVTNNQDVFYFTLGGNNPYDQSVQMPLNLITNISFKIHVDPHSIPKSDGTFGGISVGLVGQLNSSSGYTSGANSSYYQQITIPGAATNGWVTLSQTNAAADAQAYINGTGITNGFGVDFDYNSYGGYPTSPVAFWIDDVVVLTSSAPPPPPPPPVVSIASLPTPGLNLFTGQGTSLYQRESLQTVNGSYSWVNLGHAATLSYTVSSYPIAPADGFQTQIFLAPNPGTENDPDWNEPSVIFLDMENAANGANWSFRYKTNEPNGNTMLYGSGTLATVHSSTAVGTWSATFNNNTNITMTAPDGTSTNFSIPDPNGTTAADFASGVALYFGVQGGTASAASDHITVSDFSASGFGAGADFNDNFVADNGVLNQSLWETNAQYPSAVQLFASQPGNQYFLVQWTAPALNYTLSYGTNLAPGSTWQPFMLNGVAPMPTQFGSNYSQIVNTNQLLNGNPGFFVLTKPSQ